VVGRIPRIPEDALSKGALVVISEAEGRAAESLRVLRSNLEFVSRGDEHRVLMICSAQKGEGKSLVTANLAASLALAGKKVVLIDADLRRPRVHRLFSVRNTAGVSSIIAGQSTLADALQEHVLLPGAISVGGNGKGAGRERSSGGTPDVTLTLLTAGPIPPNPGEMVASQRFAELVAELRTTDFDYIIIDSPAFLAVGDAAALGAVADGIFLLVNLKMTGRPMLEDARDFLAQLPAKRLGVITVIDQSAGDERYHYYGGKY
jgi:protein-tyrosine kinase